LIFGAIYSIWNNLIAGFRNGQEGLKMANPEHPDLILLDLMMPKKSGISLFHDLDLFIELTGDQEVSK
jgi:YesN/AraC family two-component response regulator